MKFTSIISAYHNGYNTFLNSFIKETEGQVGERLTKTLFFLNHLNHRPIKKSNLRLNNLRRIEEYTYFFGLIIRMKINDPPTRIDNPAVSLRTNKFIRNRTPAFTCSDLIRYTKSHRKTTTPIRFFTY
jgi:hypothetical protein